MQYQKASLDLCPQRLLSLYTKQMHGFRNAGSCRYERRAYSGQYCPTASVIAVVCPDNGDEKTGSGQDHDSDILGFLISPNP